jgi:2-oxoisovalerate dehydrogenase E1 component alpha subunit
MRATSWGLRARRTTIRVRPLIQTRSISLHPDASVSDRPDAEYSLFSGARSRYTSSPHFYTPHADSLPPSMPCFRLVDDEGQPVDGAVLPDLPTVTLLRMMRTMISVSEFDKVFQDAQRQGRLSFYFTNRGEEACSVGSGAAQREDAWIWPQYRELGATFWRGGTVEECADQCCHNLRDPTKGRQLPMHIGSPEKHLMYVKSNLGQQVPAAHSMA